MTVLIVVSTLTDVKAQQKTCSKGKKLKIKKSEKGKFWKVGKLNF